MKSCGCTIESGSVYRILEKTGEKRSVETANFFGGYGIRNDVEVHVWEMLHPDEPAEEKVASPYGSHERPVGVGKYLGKEWRVTDEA